MTDLRRRTVTAVAYGAVVLVAVLAPPAAFWLALVVIAVLGVAELVALRAGRSAIALGILFVGGLAALGALKQLGPNSARHGTAGDLPVWLLFVVIGTWAADVSAYLVGSTFGRRRIAPRISPGKTWEGTIGGFIAATLAAIGVSALFGLPKLESVALAIGLGPAGFAGDLLESYVKRRAGVKDSGALLPGHGGILDRFDSLTAGAVFVLVGWTLLAIRYLGAEGVLLDRF